GVGADLELGGGTRRCGDGTERQRVRTSGGGAGDRKGLAVRNLELDVEREARTGRLGGDREVLRLLVVAVEQHGGANAVLDLRGEGVPILRAGRQRDRVGLAAVRDLEDVIGAGGDGVVGGSDVGGTAGRG